MGMFEIFAELQDHDTCDSRSRLKVAAEYKTEK